MVASIVSSIIFFLPFIILSLVVNGSVFAAQMEHPKVGVVKEAMAMRRNLQENGSSNKIAFGGSHSRQSGQKTAEKEPSQTHPDPATAEKKHYLTYKSLQRQAVCRNSTYASCLGSPPVPKKCPESRCKQP